MNEIGNLVSTYKYFILDIKNLINDISEILINNNAIDFRNEVWSPRDRPAWSLKETYSKIFVNSNEIFYIGIDLVNDEPYLLLSHISVEIENCKIIAFTEYDTFSHIENEEITKKEIYPGIFEFKQDWGKCTFCKVNLLEIINREIVNTDIKSIIKFLFNSSSNLEICKVKLINFV